MKIYLDVNIFIDVQRKRRGWEDSFMVIKSVMDGRCEGYISALTPVIIYFLRRKIFPEDQARKETLDLTKGFKIISLTDEILAKAFEEKRIDGLEDSIQFHSAKGYADTFITRNKSDYRMVFEEIEVLSPEEFLREYLKELK